MSLKSEIAKSTSYLRSARNAILERGGEISLTAGLKDLPEAICSIPSGSSDNSVLLKVLDGTVTDLTEQDLQGLTSIRISAFTNIISLKSVVIPDSVTSIGGSAFSSCTNLESVETGDSVTSIGGSAFSGCTNLKSVKIGKSVTFMGYHAFQKCTSLTNVYITDIVSWCGIDYNTNFSTPLSYATNLYLNGNLVTELVIPDSVTSIGGYAFYKRTSLTSVVIPDSVTSIGTYAFYGCTGLTNVTIPDSVTSIDMYAFSGCTNIVKVIFPNAITNISAGAFYNCTGCLEYDFTAASMVPTLSNKNAFTGINSSCQIKVPASLYDEWIVATNWATYADYIVAV